MLRWKDEFGTSQGRGYSQHNPTIPIKMLSIWRSGNPTTAPSRDLRGSVRISNIFVKRRKENSLRPHINEDLGVEDPVNASDYLVGGRSEHDQTRQVVFDKSAHGECE